MQSAQKSCKLVAKESGKFKQSQICAEGQISYKNYTLVRTD